MFSLCVFNVVVAIQSRECAQDDFVYFPSLCFTEYIGRLGCFSHSFTAVVGRTPFFNVPRTSSRSDIRSSYTPSFRMFRRGSSALALRHHTDARARVLSMWSHAWMTMASLFTTFSGHRSHTFVRCQGVSFFIARRFSIWFYLFGLAFVKRPVARVPKAFRTRLCPKVLSPFDVDRLD